MVFRGRNIALLASFVLAFGLLTSFSSASVVHRVGLEDSGAQVNSSLVIESDEPSGGTRITVGQEEDMEVLSVESEVGEASYSYEDGGLVLEVDSPLPRKEHDIRVRWRSEGAVRERFQYLKKMDVSLFGFEGKETSASITSENVLSWHEPVGFRSEYSGDELKFKGEGHLWIRGYLSDGGQETENYYHSGEKDLSETEELSPLVIYITGRSNPHERIPVVFLDDESYNEEFSAWSEGTHETGGLVVLREELEGPDKIKTLLHETVHAFNSRAMNWDRTGTAYYDEGKAQFVELLASEAMDSPRAEIFGEGVTFEEDGSRYRLPSRSSPGELWSYYEEGEDWIKYWSPRGEESHVAREFGYALSELMIREKVKEEGVESLREMHHELLQVEETVEDPKEKADLMEELIDLKPCYAERRAEFEDCLEEVNDQGFDFDGVDLNQTFEDEREEIEIEERAVEEVVASEQFGIIVENFLRNVERFLMGVSEWISKRL